MAPALLTPNVYMGEVNRKNFEIEPDRVSDRLREIDGRYATISSSLGEDLKQADLSDPGVRQRIRTKIRSLPNIQEHFKFLLNDLGALAGQVYGIERYKDRLPELQKQINRLEALK